MIDRRVAFVSLALALLTSPLVAGAQQAGKVPQIGLIRPGSPPDPFAEAFLQGLRDLGYVEGRTIAIAYRWAEGKTDRIPALAEELSRLKVEVIVTGDIQVAKRVTSTIPVVSPTMNEPVEEGLVASLARPGGHITGLSLMSPELNAKRLELLKETFPQVSRVAVLHDPRVTPADLQATEAAARTLGLHLQIFEVRSLDDLETAFVAATQARADAVHILNSSFFAANRVRIVEVVRQTQLPATYPHRLFVEAGRLMSYGPHFPDLFRRAAAYVDKILKGAHPGDLPVEQPVRFELVINLQTAQALGLSLAPTLLFQADEVIQ